MYTLSNFKTVTSSLIASLLLVSISHVCAQEKVPNSDNFSSANPANTKALQKIKRYLDFDESKLENFEVSQKQNDYEVEVTGAAHELPGANGPIISGKDDKGLSIELCLVSSGSLKPAEVLKRNEAMSKAIEASVSGHSPISPLTSIGPAFSSFDGRGELKALGQSFPYLIGKCPERPGSTVLFGLFQPKDKNMTVLVTASQPGGGTLDTVGVQDFLDAIKSFQTRRETRPHWGVVPTPAAVNTEAQKIVSLDLPLPSNFEIKEVNQKYSFIVLENTTARQLILFHTVAPHKPSAEKALEELSTATKDAVLHSQAKNLPMNVKIDFAKLLQGAPYKSITERGKFVISSGTIHYFTGIASSGNKAFVAYFDEPHSPGLEIVAMQMNKEELDVKQIEPLLKHIKKAVSFAKMISPLQSSPVPIKE
ncbi:MAG: hypothetical protein P4L53_20365 [Candidatus Obscuribacterales bacterium]|nr:hypothetical protein [Candidatus Obscuribacterales bacterium]